MTNLAFISMAYKMTALQLMIGEANFFAQHLNLSTPHPIQITNITYSYVSPPVFGFGGVIDTTNFDFSFYKEGKLWQIANKIEQYGNVERYPEWKKSPSLIDNKGAYQLATQWLYAVSVDVPSLEKKFKAHITQPFHYDPPHSEHKEYLPVYEVKWGDDEHPAVNVTILGTTKELMILVFNDLTFSKRPPLVIPNAGQLASRPDPVVKKFQSAVAAVTNSHSELIPLRSPDPQRQPSP